MLQYTKSGIQPCIIRMVDRHSCSKLSIASLAQLLLYEIPLYVDFRYGFRESKSTYSDISLELTDLVPGLVRRYVYRLFSFLHNFSLLNHV